MVSDERLSRTSNLSWQNVARREKRYLAFDQPKPMTQAFALMLLAVSWAAAGQTPDSTNGCTDASACNYNPNATVGDGSCVSCAVVSAPSGFEALPGGQRMNAGNFQGAGTEAFFWTFTELNSVQVWFRSMVWNATEVVRNSAEKNVGMSVRCIKAVN